MSIDFIVLKVVFVFAWIIGDANSHSFQYLALVLFTYSMCSHLGMLLQLKNLECVCWEDLLRSMVYIAKKYN